MLRWITEYHQKTWMHGKYNFEDWNLYRERLRTNNLAEARNRRVVQVVGKHAQFYVWVQGIQKLSALTYCRWVPRSLKYSIYTIF